MSYLVHRYHDISCGHRVYGHEGKCAHAHGHNYRTHFTCKAEGKLDSLGRVIDFGVIKTKLCEWLEDNWDHRFLLWEDDPWRRQLAALDPDGIVAVPFNPTAENMAEYLVEVVGPQQFEGLGVRLTECKVEETSKCWASYCR